MKTDVRERHRKAHRPYSEEEFDVKAFLKDGRTIGYLLYALDGKPFLVKYKDQFMKEGKLHRLVIWLIDPCASKKDIVWPSYVSETFSHFFGPYKASDDYLEVDDGGLVVAEISLEADESGLLFLIADLNYKHIQEAVLGKYYGTHRGEYDFIGRSMVGIAGKVLFGAYGIRFLGVKTDKTKGFYWRISDRPPKNPVIPGITSQLGRIRDIETKREIRDDFYINIFRKIAFRRFDPYVNLDDAMKADGSWERHCIDIWNIFSDNELLIARLLEESGNVAVEGTNDFINRMMVKYRAKNIEWFTSINSAMRRLVEANLTEDRVKRDCIIDEIMSLEIDPLIKKEHAKLKQVKTNDDITAMIHETMGHYSGIFPVFDLSGIEEIEIGIIPHEKSK